MIRRKLTLKRVDPWSVLKFGFVVNVALLLVGLLAFWILWMTVRRLGLIEQFCGSVGTIVLDLQECSVNGGNIFRTVLFLGLLGVVVQTGIAVFGAFLYNLIADLTGGLAFSFLDESGDAVLTSARKARASEDASRPAAAAGSSTGGGSSGGRAAGAPAGTAASGAADSARAGSTRSGPPHDTGSFRPSSPPRPEESAPSPRPSPSSSDRGADGRGDRPASRPWQGEDHSTPGPTSAPSPAPRPGAQVTDDASSRTDSDTSASGSRRDEPEEDERDAERPSRPSGSSLWGDPTRSRE